MLADELGGDLDCLNEPFLKLFATLSAISAARSQVVRFGQPVKLNNSCSHGSSQILDISPRLGDVWIALVFCFTSRQFFNEFVVA